MKTLAKCPQKRIFFKESPNDSQTERFDITNEFSEIDDWKGSIPVSDDMLVSNQKTINSSFHVGDMKV